MQILLFVSEKVFLRAAKKTKTNLDDEIVARTRVPLAFLVLMIGGRLAAEALEFAQIVNFIIENIFGSIIVLTTVHVVIIVVNILLDNWGKKLVSRTRSTVDDDIFHMIHRFAKILFYILGFMYVLSIWGVEIGPMIASLGIAGLAVALAIKPTLENIFGGITLIVDRVLRVGDTVQLEDGSMGKVMKVSLRSTKIKTFDNELMTIPNGKLADSKITNWHMPNKKVRITINFGVEYGSDATKVKKLILGLIDKEKGILKDPSPYVHFTEMADSSINFMVRFWIEDISNKLETKDSMITKIYDTLNKNKIGIPFPTRTIYMEKS